MLKRFLTFLCFLFLSFFSCYPQLIADFSVDRTNGCSPFIVQFTDNSTPSGSVVFRKWIFGNGNFSSAQNPQASYGNPGTYDVTLIVSDGVNFDTIIKQNLITVFFDPLPDFTTSSGRSGCRPLNVFFKDSSVQTDGQIIFWEWDFGDGITSNDTNPLHTYNIGGTYPVSLHVIDANGCDNAILHNNYVSVSETPYPSFFANNPNSCSIPFSVNFTNTSTGISALTYEWDFGDTTTSTAFEPQHIYDNFGLYTVSLIATDSSGCRDTMQKLNYIKIRTADANFSPSTNVVCAGKSVLFSNLSIGSNSYIWNFGDGFQSTQISPSHIFQNPGIYIVSLIASVSGSSCDDTHTDTITVEGITASYSYSPQNYCELPDTISYTDSSTNAISWQWRFGDSTFSNIQNPVHIYNYAGTHIDTLIVTSLNGCKDTISHAVTIIIPNVLYSPNQYMNPLLAEGCAPLTVNFINLTTYNCSWDSIISYDWDFGDSESSTSANPSHIFQSSGGYGITLTATTGIGCRKIYRDTIKAGDKPVADFSVSNDSSCSSNQIYFYDQSMDSNKVNGWIWKMNDTVFYAKNPIVRLLDTGYFDVTLISDYNGCTDTITKDNFVYINGPVVNLQSQFNCDTPMTYYFNGNIKNAERFYWDFGDGDVDSVNSNPVHTYSSTGDYMVVLKAFNDTKGCSFFDSSYIYVRNVISMFTADVTEICPGQSVLFNGSSSQDEAYFMTDHAGLYLWNFGDSTKYRPQYTYDTITSVNISHIFKNRGTYLTSMMVKGVNGCVDFMYKTIKVYQPDVNFIADQPVGCAPLSVQFTDQTVSDTLISTWFWTLGNGVTSTLQNPNNTYTETANYSISLTVTDTLGCSKTRTKPSYISIRRTTPVFNVNDTTLCFQDSAVFVNETAGDSLTYLWNFGNGNTDTTKNPVYVYPDTGNFSITLTVTDNIGCNFVLTKTDYIDVQKIPQALFFADTLTANCYPLLVNYVDSSVSPNINLWNWEFGDGAASTLQNPQHIYTRPGIYNITLAVTTSFGCSDTFTRSGYINVKGPYAEISISSDVVCKGEDVFFYIDTMIDVFSYQWDFGDGIISDTIFTGTGSPDSAFHVYNWVGKLYPQLFFSDSLSSCSRLTRDSVIINLITADFHVDDSVSCEQSSVPFINNSFGESSWIWDFGDSMVAFTSDPQHTYFSSGTYNVMLTVFDDYSCRDSVIKSFVVSPLPQLQAINDTAICTGDTIILNAGSGYYAYLWSDGSIDSTFASNAPAMFSIKVQNNEGCWTRPDTIIIQEIPTPDPQLGNDTSLCTGSTLILTPEVSQWDSFLWQDFSIDSIFTVDTAGTYYVRITNECGIVSDTIFIKEILFPQVNLGADTVICNGDSIILFAQTDTTYSYHWQDNSTDSLLTVTTGNTYSITVTNVCSYAKDSIEISQRIFPFINLGNDTSICENAIKVLHVTEYVYDNYLWQDFSTDSIFTVDTAGAYYVRITNECGDVSDSIFIKEILFPQVNLGADTVICNGDSIILFAQTDTTYNYHWQDNSSDSLLTVTTGNTYSITVTNVCSTAKDSIEISQRIFPFINLGNDTSICENSIKVLHATEYVYDNYLWQDFSTDSIFTVDTAGTYYVRITNECGIVSDTIFIKEILFPQVNLGADTVICTGDSIILFAQTDTTYSYHWQDNTTDSLLTVTTGNTYSITVTNVCSTAKDSIEISQRIFPFINLGNDTSICENAIKVLHATEYIYDNYLWQDFSTDSIFTVDTAGAYYVRITNECGNVSDTIFIKEILFPQVNLGADTVICTGDSIILYAQTDTTYSYQWQDNSTDSLLTVTTGNIYSITVTNVCSYAKDSIEISQRIFPNVNLGNDTIICESDNILLNATGYIYDTYLWNSGDTNSVLAIDTLGIYKVTVSNICGNITDSIIITEKYLPVISLGNDTIICDGTNITLNAGQGFDSYLWLNGDTTQYIITDKDSVYTVYVSNVCGVTTDTLFLKIIPVTIDAGNDKSICDKTNTMLLSTSGFDHYFWDTGDTLQNITVDSAATYTVSATNKCGTATDSVTVTIISLPFTHLGQDTAISLGTLILDAGNSGATFQWSDGSSLQTYTVPDSVHKVWVMVTKDGCSITDTINILDFLPEGECTVDLPTAFSPNGDGLNDILYVRGYCIETISFIIFNRYGQKIFETTNRNSGWDGFYKGEKQETEVYMYYLWTKFTNGKSIVKKGNITLLN